VVFDRLAVGKILAARYWFETGKPFDIESRERKATLFTVMLHLQGLSCICRVLLFTVMLHSQGLSSDVAFAGS